MKKKRVLLICLSFFIPLFIYLFVFFINGLFCEKSIIVGDSFSQYFPLFNYLKQVMNGNEGLFFSFHKNFGGTMFGTFFYYLSSPFNIFLFLFNKASIPFFISILTVVKLSLCGLAMYLYMSYKHKSDSFIILIFSLCYSLMGYNLNFYIHIMWLDVVLIAPIVILGLDRIINKESSFLYIFSLFFAILSNYYLAYMLCIFCVLYFIYESLIVYDFKSDKKELFSVFKEFLFSSLFAGLMCSFFLIPCIFESRNYFRSLGFSDIFKFSYNYFDLFSKTYIGSMNSSDILNYSSINLYCGVVMIPLVLFYVFDRRISKRERCLSLFLILFMILPCFVNPLNYFWHLFSEPNYYNYRYSFLLCFFILNIAYKSFRDSRFNRVFYLLYLFLYSIVSLYLIIITHFGNYYASLNYLNIWLTLFFLIVYYFILLLRNIFFKKVIFCILVFIEVIINLFIVFHNNEYLLSSYLSFDVYSDIINRYKDSRFEFTRNLSNNDSLIMNYYGVNNFLSTNNGRIVRFMVQVGIKDKYSFQNLYFYSDGQFIFDSIVGLKYIISPVKLDNYKLIDTIIYDDKVDVLGGDRLFVYENPNAIGFGYVIADSCNNIDFSFDYDEKVLNCILGSDISFYKRSVLKETNGVYSTIIKHPSKFYLYVGDNVINDFNVDASNIIRYSNDFVYINNSNKNFVFNVYGDIVDDSLSVYSFDYDILKKTISSYNFDKLDYRIDGDRLIGDIDTSGGLLMLTIPYEKGYDIRVDGEKVDYIEVLDTFVGVNLSNGKHHIEVSYRQPFLFHGFIVSFLSFICLFVKKYLQKKF